MRQHIFFSLLVLALVLFLLPIFAVAKPPDGAVKFVILKPSDSTVGTPVTITIESQKSNNQVDESYQNDVTLVASGSATGGGLVDIVNGVGTIVINDLVAETVTLSLVDSQSTGLDVSSTQMVAFAAAPDTTAPSAVSNLAASNPTTSSVDLFWTAPGDDGNTGTAATYDIRYRTNNINNGNWNSATQVTGEPAPQAAGTAQSMTISGLTEGTEYFFAIKTSDEVPNESALSNVVSTTTLSSGGGGTPAWNQQKFWFRDDDGDEIAATGFGAEDVNQNTNIINVAPGTNFRLRFAVKLTDADGNIAPQLEFKEGTDCATGSWTIIAPESSVLNLQLSQNFIDAAATTQRLVGSPKFIAGQIFESTNPAGSLNLFKNESTEYEWSLKVSLGTPFAITYSFRVTNSGAVLDNYDQCPSLTTQLPPPPPPPPTCGDGTVDTGEQCDDGSANGVCPATCSASCTINDCTPPPPPPPSGGGGGGGGGARPTTVTFLGKAFPGAKILVIDKPVADAARTVSQEIVTQDDGSFQTSFIGIMQSRHSFGLIIKDKEGRNSQTKFFTIDVLANDLIIKDVIISPTIDFASRSVTRGNNATIIGYASPESSVALEIDGIVKKEVKAEKDGSYRAEIATGELDFGNYRVRTKQIISEENRESDFSLTNTLVVSRLVLPKADLSGDGRVDIKDWSIFLFHWTSKDMTQKKIIDFNEDGKVDISDFSIFVRNIRK